MFPSSSFFQNGSSILFVSVIKRCSSISLHSIIFFLYNLFHLTVATDVYYSRNFVSLYFFHLRHFQFFNYSLTVTTVSTVPLRSTSLSLTHPILFSLIFLHLNRTYFLFPVHPFSYCFSEKKNPYKFHQIPTSVSLTLLRFHQQQWIFKLQNFPEPGWYSIRYQS